MIGTPILEEQLTASTELPTLSHWEVRTLQVSEDTCQYVQLTEIPNWKLPHANQEQDRQRNHTALT